MTRAELVAFLPWNGALPHLGAGSYAVPTLAWLQGPCYAAFRSRYWTENLDKWTFRWECRDFAAAFRLFAIECWATSTGVTTPANDDGLSVGEMWFLPDPTNPNSGHAICPVICDRGLQFIEPQTGQLFPCSDAQLASRFFLRF
jgi:hypothetical protein